MQDLNQKLVAPVVAEQAAAHGFFPHSLLWWSSTLQCEVPDGRPVAFAPLVSRTDT